MSVECISKNIAETVGEGPHWDSATRTLLHVDIMSGNIHRWNSVTGENHTLHLEENVSLVVPCRTGGYIITLGRTLAHLDWDTKSITKLHEVEQGTKNRFNDGKCDRKGRLWTGTMGQVKGPMEVERETSHLYSMELDGSLINHLSGISLSNGMAWSPDNKTMYYADTLTRNVDAFDYDYDHGTISNRRVVFDFNKHTVDEYGFPDGMTIDTEGKLWVACPMAGQVKRFDPKTGEEMRCIDFPVQMPTSCCFGGENMDELYVTSLRKWSVEMDLEKYPLSGSLFKVTGLGVGGFPADMFQGDLTKMKTPPKPDL